jgi:hypothetical protein
MYLLLLVFGWLLGVAGMVLAGSGMSLRDGTFDATILTPGIVAAAGGLLLVGLGAGLRTLQRIERTLAARPMPRVLAIADGAKGAENVETPGEPARIPFAPKATHESQSGVAARDIVADKSPTAAPGADKASPPIPAIAAVPDANVETPPSGKRNGNGTAAVRTGLRPSASLRRPSAGGASAPIAQSIGVTPFRSQQGGDMPSAAASVSNPESAAAGASVLKSGVVNGMPYTLYSDGSIEAQLPEGTLRFGSITELRNHIEQSA